MSLNFDHGCIGRWHCIEIGTLVEGSALRSDLISSLSPGIFNLVARARAVTNRTGLLTPKNHFGDRDDNDNCAFPAAIRTITASPSCRLFGPHRPRFTAKRLERTATKDKIWLSALKQMNFSNPGIAKPIINGLQWRENVEFKLTVRQTPLTDWRTVVARDLYGTLQFPRAI